MYYAYLTKARLNQLAPCLLQANDTESAFLYMYISWQRLVLAQAGLLDSRSPSEYPQPSLTPPLDEILAPILGSRIHELILGSLRPTHERVVYSLEKFTHSRYLFLCSFRCATLDNLADSAGHLDDGMGYQLIHPRLAQSLPVRAGAIPHQSPVDDGTWRYDRIVQELFNNADGDAGVGRPVTHNRCNDLRPRCFGCRASIEKPVLGTFDAGEHVGE